MREDRFGERDHGIDGNEELGLVGRSVERKRTHRQVSAGGETHHAYAGGVHTVLGRVVVHVVQSRFDIFQHVRPFVTYPEHAETEDIRGHGRNAVAQQIGIDAVLPKPFAHGNPFGGYVQPRVTATRANNNRHTCVLLR